MQQMVVRLSWQAGKSRDPLWGDPQLAAASQVATASSVTKFLPVQRPESGELRERPGDLLFYNYLLRRFVVIDLKIEDFKPEFAGKMNFYLNAIDELERQPGDELSIGLVLCPGRDKTVTEWALRGLKAPVAVARYTTGDMTLTDTPPSELQGALPDLAELASGLSRIVEAANVIYDDESATDEPGGA
jgi:hypothetical protein